MGDAIHTGCGIVAAWLIGLPRRAGRHLFAMNDNEARWHGWQVTETLGGLGRRYRYLRFETLKTDTALRRDEIAGGAHRIGPDDDGRPRSGGR